MSSALLRKYMSEPMRVDKDTWLSMGLVITLIGAAVSFGVVYSKVETLSQNVTDLTKTLTLTREQLIETRSTNAQILDTLSGIKSDIHDIKKSNGQ